MQLKPEEIIASRILMNTNEIFLSSVGVGGGPRSSIITKLRSEGHNVIYFAAPVNSQKVQNIKTNPNASICYYNGCDSITLMGYVEFVTDLVLKKQLWLEWCRRSNALTISEYDFCPMKFVTTEATFWIRNNLTTISYL